ncbi:MAG: hypothetical protein ACQERK_04345 [Campylobacterota bacterium]
MTRFFAVILVAAAFFISGCSVKGEFKFLINDNKTYTHAVEYTKKLQLKEGRQTRMLVTATYINKLYTTLPKDKEHFIVGIPKESGEFFHNYQLTLDGKAADTVTKAKKIHTLNLPLINQWNTYYRVSFANVSANALTLSLSHPDQGSDSATFIKVR